MPAPPVIPSAPVKLSARASAIGESATLRVTRRAAELRAQGVSVVDLGAGEPDFPSPAVAVEAARRALAEGFTRYTPGSGLPALRAAVADSYRRRYGTPWKAADSVITVGGKAALFEIALAVFDDGQEVVLPSPYWVTFPEQVRFAGATPVFVPTCGEDGFRIHAAPLIAAVTERTRAVLVNSPCNPTGGVMGADDLRQLVTFAAGRGILVIADETYERFSYSAPHASAAALAAEFPETVVLVGSFSKTYAMTGWRIGYALGPAPVIQAVENIQSHATSNATSFAMVGALEALLHAEPEVEVMMAEYRARRDMLVPLLNAIPGFRCRPPEGAFYAFPDVSACFHPGRADSIALAEYLLEEAGVATVPGAAFGAEAHLRLSFACSRATLAEGLERIAEALAR
ncbi:MAG TPA: pyridoxal phosphate-dependent aminotransferase [Thermoanaerobaculia bacterium]|nr:pyridoxal phosphate-dependent aminotransferase [Thermoanaerobaculia bacterium]